MSELALLLHRLLVKLRFRRQQAQLLADPDLQIELEYYRLRRSLEVAELRNVFRTDLDRLRCDLQRELDRRR
jgi:hypothetical protein